ncbi:MAG: Crp/Fnr family transcriptional regulator [bacterium]
MDLLGCLSAIPLFAGLDRDQYEVLSHIVVDQVFKRGQTIFTEGEEGRGFYVMILGRVKIFKLSPEGKEQILHIVGPGEPFGEVAVFAGQPFPAHSETIEESRTFFFPRADFIELIKKNPLLAMNMLAVLSQRLAGLTVLIDSLSLKEVPARLSAYLLAQSERKSTGNDLSLDITKGQLAGSLGTIPETLSRILAKMAKGGLIHSDGRRITIMNRQGLEELAEGQKRL